MEKTMKKIIIITLAVVLVTSGLATAAILDFEDLWTGSEEYNVIGSIYHGFTMGNDGYYMTQICYPNSGYYYGTDGRVSMFTWYARPISLKRESDFNVGSLDLTAAWNLSQPGVIEGWEGGSKIYSRLVNATNTGPTLITLNWTGIDTMLIIPMTYDIPGGNQFIIDNLSYTAPLPSTLLFVGTGLLGLAGYRGKKS
jgi:hypothetical protein